MASALLVPVSTSRQRDGPASPTFYRPPPTTTVAGVRTRATTYGAYTGCWAPRESDIRYTETYGTLTALRGRSHQSTQKSLLLLSFLFSFFAWMLFIYTDKETAAERAHATGRFGAAKASGPLPVQPSSAQDPGGGQRQVGHSLVSPLHC